jgi:hypothetical protein
MSGAAESFPLNIVMYLGDNPDPIDLGVINHTEKGYLNVMNSTERSKKIVPLEPEVANVRESGALFEAYMYSLGLQYTSPYDVEVIRRGLYLDLPMPETLEELSDYREDRVKFINSKMDSLGRKLSHPIQGNVLDFSLNYFDAMAMTELLDSVRVPLEVEGMERSPIECVDYILSKITATNDAYKKLNGKKFVDENATRKELNRALGWMTPARDNSLGKRMI